MGASAFVLVLVLASHPTHRMVYAGGSDSMPAIYRSYAECAEVREAQVKVFDAANPSIGDYSLGCVPIEEVSKFPGDAI
jgi:hypothetical protein